MKRQLYVFPSEEAAAAHFDAVQEAYRREGLGGLMKSPLGVAMLAGVLEDGPPPEISLRREWQLRYERDGQLWARFAAGLRRRTSQRVGREIFHLWCVDSAHCVECGEPFERYVDAACAAGENGVLSGYRVQR